MLGFDTDRWQCWGLRKWFLRPLGTAVERRWLRARLRELTVHLRIGARIVQRPGQDGDGNRSGLRAVVRPAAVVVPLPRSDRSDGEPQQQKQGEQAPNEPHDAAREQRAEAVRRPAGAAVGSRALQGVFCGRKRVNRTNLGPLNLRTERVKAVQNEIKAPACGPSGHQDVQAESAQKHQGEEADHSYCHAMILPVADQRKTRTGGSERRELGGPKMTGEISECVLVLQLHAARKRARAAAEAEVVTLLEGLAARRLPGGPLAEVSGVAWVGVGTAALDTLHSRLRHVGYSSLIRLAEPLGTSEDLDPGWTRARWKGVDYVLRPVFSESRSEIQRDAPDRRGFLLECGDGEVRRIVGYRGGRGPLEHRALPTYDARLVVNLLGQPAGGVMLDPFAGAGSIPMFARRAGWRTIALDRDPTLRFGLAEVAATTVVGDASSLPFLPARLDAVAAEPPYRDDALPLVREAVRETARLLKPDGRLVLLVPSSHAAALSATGSSVGLEVDLDLPIDRKGLSVRCLRLRAPAA